MTIAILIFALGITVGMLINELLLYLKKSSGTLQIDTKNSDHDIYRLEISDKLENLPKKHIIVLKVDPNADLSQK